MSHGMFATLLVMLLAGCVSAPLRSDVSAFALLQSGQIAPSSVQAFADCVLDGFNDSHYIITNITVRQQRRSDGFRVETLTHSAILISADVLFDGKVALFESRAAALIDTSGERKAFAVCIERYRGTK